MLPMIGAFPGRRSLVFKLDATDPILDRLWDKDSLYQTPGSGRSWICSASHLFVPTGPAESGWYRIKGCVVVFIFLLPHGSIDSQI